MTDFRAKPAKITFAELCTVNHVPPAEELLPDFEVQLDLFSKTKFSIDDSKVDIDIEKVRRWGDWSLPSIDFNQFLMDLSEGRASIAENSKERTSRDLDQAINLVEWGGSLLPKKVVDEQIGDLRERLNDLESDGAHPWRIQLTALMGVFWATLYTLRDFKGFLIPAALWPLLRKLLG